MRPGGKFIQSQSLSRCLATADMGETTNTNLHGGIVRLHKFPLGYFNSKLDGVMSLDLNRQRESKRWSRVARTAGQHMT